MEVQMITNFENQLIYKYTKFIRLSLKAGPAQPGPLSLKLSRPGLKPGPARQI